MAAARYPGLGMNYGVLQAFKLYDDPSTTLTHAQWITQIKKDLDDMWRDGIRYIRLWLYNPINSPAYAISHIIEIGQLAKTAGFYVVGGVTTLLGPTLNDTNWPTISVAVLAEAVKAQSAGFDEFCIDNEAYLRQNGLTGFFTKYGALATSVKGVFSGKITYSETEFSIPQWVGQTIGSGTFVNLDYLAMNCYGSNNVESGVPLFIQNLNTCWLSFGAKSYISEFNIYASQPYNKLSKRQISEFTKMKLDKIYSIGFTRAYFFSWTSQNDEFSVKKMDGTFMRNREVLTIRKRNVEGVM